MSFVTLSCLDVSSQIKLSCVDTTSIFFLSQRQVTEAIAFYIAENDSQNGGKHGVPKNYQSTWSVVQVTQPQIFFQHCHESISPLKRNLSEKMDFADGLS